MKQQKEKIIQDLTQLTIRMYNKKIELEETINVDTNNIELLYQCVQYLTQLSNDFDMKVNHNNYIVKRNFKKFTEFCNSVQINKTAQSVIIADFYCYFWICFNSIFKIHISPIEFMEIFKNSFIPQAICELWNKSIPYIDLLARKNQEKYDTKLTKLVEKIISRGINDVEVELQREYWDSFQFLHDIIDKKYVSKTLDANSSVISIENLNLWQNAYKVLNKIYDTDDIEIEISEEEWEILKNAINVLNKILSVTIVEGVLMDNEIEELGNSINVLKNVINGLYFGTLQIGVDTPPINEFEQNVAKLVRIKIEKHELK